VNPRAVFEAPRYGAIEGLSLCVLRERALRNALRAARAAPPSSQLGSSGAHRAPCPSAGHSSSSAPCRDSGSNSGSRSRHSYEWQVHREAAVTTPSIVGDRSLGVRADAAGARLYLFRRRKLSTNYRQLLDVTRAARRAGRAAPARRVPRDELSIASERLRDRAWFFGLSASWDATARRGIENEGAQWARAVRFSDSRPSSLAAPAIAGMQGDRGTSTNPIVLVSRVCTGRSEATKLRQRMRNNDPFPLPLLMTFPVSFERREKSAHQAPQSTSDTRGARRRVPDIRRGEL